MEEETLMRGLPSASVIETQLRDLLENARLKDFIAKMLEESKIDAFDRVRLQTTDTILRAEKDRLTFGEQSPKENGEGILAPRFEKTQSMLAGHIDDVHDTEAKDIPFLRAVSESAKTNIEIPQNCGGFSLTKPGVMRTPLKSSDKLQEETFGRKDSLSQVVKKLNMRSAEKKQPTMVEKTAYDVPWAVDSIQKVLEGFNE